MSAIHPNTPYPPSPRPDDLAGITEPAAASGGTMTDTLNAHRGKLAIGVAATLGLMIFYNWREKRLAKTDPEEYARLQRLKAGVRAGEAQIDLEAQAGQLAEPDVPGQQPKKANGRNNGH